MISSLQKKRIGMEITLDEIVEEVGNDPAFRDEYKMLREARNKFQNKCKELYPNLPWQF
jgi:hypothetical protein